LWPFKRKAAPVEAPSPTGLTGQAFTVSVGGASGDAELTFHRSRIAEVSEAITRLKAEGKDASAYERALKVHRLAVELSGNG
jgi:hypothetical protein